VETQFLAKRITNGYTTLLILIYISEWISASMVAKQSDFAFDYVTEVFDSVMVVQGDCFEWLQKVPAASIHAIVTDPPYGVKEYELDQLAKKDNGSGGIWRLPPAFDGSTRSPLPRFTALSSSEIQILKEYFTRWSQLVTRVLVPGAHVFVSSNAYLSQSVFNSIVNGGLEFRGEIIRLVRTMRGGDRPKNAEAEFPGCMYAPTRRL